MDFIQMLAREWEPPKIQGSLEIGGWTVKVYRPARIVWLYDTAGRKRLVAYLVNQPQPDKIAGACWTYPEGGLCLLDQPDHYFDRLGNELSPEPEAGKWAWLVDLMQEAGLALPEGD